MTDKIRCDENQPAQHAVALSVTSGRDRPVVKDLPSSVHPR